MIYKRLKLLNATYKNKLFRNVLILGAILILGFINSGCEKCDIDDEDQNVTSDEYYVKYEVNSSTIYIGGKLNVTINTEDNVNKTLIVKQRTKWETTIGPVKKGFNAKLSVVAQGETNGQLKLNAAINVSKNDSPFALKEIDDSGIPRDSLQIQYTIDY